MPHKFDLQAHENNIRKVLKRPAIGGGLRDAIANRIKNRASGRVNGITNTVTRRT
ncbi:hypothetical protein LCGC14_0527450 [marine sediment metagenome]|uniref:Uncharacterized protein n=1 Tax=marine sediment metagenome TaxID=412755 RepID=A0A0F9S1C6_9ZZZZ